jgi:hypothetical protein
LWGRGINIVAADVAIINWAHFLAFTRH